MSKIIYRYNPDNFTYYRVKKSSTLLKILFQAILIIAILFLVIWYSIILFNRLEINKFSNIIGIVGGIASVIGLLSFFTQKIKRKDIENIGLDYFREMAQTADKIKEKEKILLDKENQLSIKESQIKELEIKKAELEFIVKKASMTIFIKDQLEHLEDRIVELITENKEISRNLKIRNNLLGQLDALGEQIESTKDSELINEVINLVKKKENAPKIEPSFFNLFTEIISKITFLKNY